VLTYSTPIDSASTSGSLSSDFIPVLGSYSGQSGLVYSLYLSLYTFEQMLSSMQYTASYFHNNTVGYNTSLAGAVSNATTLMDNANSGLSQYNTALENSNKYTDGYKVVVFVFYAAVIVFAVLCLLTAVITYKATSKCCRMFMYASCVMLTLVTLLGFLISVGLSVAAPVTSWGCIYLNESISSQYNFQSNPSSMQTI
jgi:hypothetical protein